jgi:hypothetical protein
VRYLLRVTGDARYGDSMEQVLYNTVLGNWDEFGNPSLVSSSGVPLSGLTATNPNGTGPNPYNPATNHLVSVDAAGGYDARGNVIMLGAVKMGYDADGNMKNTVDSGTGQSVTWIYDAEGQRAQKLIAGGATVLDVHDAFGQLAAEYNSVGVTPSCVTCYLSYSFQLLQLVPVKFRESVGAPCIV